MMKTCLIAFKRYATTVFRLRLKVGWHKTEYVASYPNLPECAQKHIKT